MLFADTPVAAPATRPADDLQEKLLDAIGKRDTKSVEALVKQGAKVNVAQPEYPPLCKAVNTATDGYVTMSALLIKLGADANSANSYGCSVLVLAVHHQNLALVKLLIEQKANLNPHTDRKPLAMACDVAAVKIVPILIAAAAEVDGIDDAGDTPLHHAARNGNVEVIKLLIAAKAVPSIRNSHGRTPYDEAIHAHKDDAAKALRE